MQLLLPSIIYFIAFSHALMIAIVMVQRSRGKGPSLLLAIVVGLFAYKLLESGLLLSGLYVYTPHLLDLLPGMALFLGPFFFAYIRKITGHPDFSLGIWVVLLVPALANWSLNVPDILQTADQKIAMWGAALSAEPGGLSELYILRVLGMKAILLAFLTMSFQLIARFESKTEMLRSDAGVDFLRNLKALTAGLIGLEFVWLVMFGAQQLAGVGLLSQVSSIWLLLTSVFMLGIGFRAMSDVHFFLSPEERSLAANSAVLAGPSDVPTSGSDKIKYLHSALPESTGQEIASLLERHLEEQQDYLDEKLSLTRLSASVGLKSHTVSQVINQHMGTNFYKLINTYRVQYAIDLLEDPQVSFPLERIAVESGFSNRVTFNKAFRGVTGSSPSEYRRQMAGQNKKTQDQTLRR